MIECFMLKNIRSLDRPKGERFKSDHKQVSPGGIKSDQVICVGVWLGHSELKLSVEWPAWNDSGTKQKTTI